MQVKVKILDKYIGLKDEEGKLIDLVPRKAHTDDAGYDLVAAERVIIPAAKHETVTCVECLGLTTIHVPGRAAVSCGISLEMEMGYEGQVRPRSGLARNHGIGIPNAPGTVDAGYRGEISCTLINFGGKDFVVKPGLRIAQLVIAQVAATSMKLVTDELSETSRGVSGFGSTGMTTAEMVARGEQKQQFGVRNDGAGDR